MTYFEWFVDMYSPEKKAGDLFCGTTLTPSEALVADLTKLENAGLIVRNGTSRWDWTEMGAYIAKMFWAMKEL